MPGQEITTGRLNAPVPAVRIGPGSHGAGATDRTGSHLTHPGRRPILALLSGSGPAYTFTQQIDADGNYAGGPRTGTAYEVNKITGLAGNTVRAYPDRSGNYRFQWVAASVGSGDAIVGLCPCPKTPRTLTFTVIWGTAKPQDFPYLQSCTLTYGGSADPGNIGQKNNPTWCSSKLTGPDGNPYSLCYFCQYSADGSRIITVGMSVSGGGQFVGFGSPNTCSPFYCSLAPTDGFSTNNPNGRLLITG